jgi:molybdopterin-guanine dinucleotide biosynthesis protein
MKVYGVTGWKNSGKTTLVERLVAEITARGLTVSTLKHAHHSFDVDHAPARTATATGWRAPRQVLVSSRPALGADDREPRRPRAAARRPPRPARSRSISC